MSRGIDDSDCEAMLEAAPQLLRLLPADVEAAASAATALVDLKGLVDQPTLLTFPASAVRDGERYLCTMMAMPQALVAGACRMEPKLLTSGIEAGLQEQAVASALGAASSATSGAFNKVVGDAAAAAKRRRANPPGSGSLGG